MKNTSYNEQLVRRSIVVVRNSTTRKTIDKHKTFIYNCLVSIINKNVNNFFNLIKDVEKSLVIHERGDIVSECYIILDKCIGNFDLTLPDKKFYFYYNKSLSRGLYRLQEKQYKKKSCFNTVNFEDVQNLESKTFTFNNSYPLLLSKNFSEKEMLLMQSKIDEEKIADCCKKIEISRDEYYKLLSSIRRKINKKYLL